VIGWSRINQTDNVRTVCQSYVDTADVGGLMSHAPSTCLMSVNNVRMSADNVNHHNIQ